MSDIVGRGFVLEGKEENVEILVKIHEVQNINMKGVFPLVDGLARAVYCL